ncbi:zinc finger protein-like 1 homolog [Ptychodera flava]|uniref:zinc finger protein-like 1 homolog n=1 Tax=Ptychodera flava TaxID=63121 RepID=UPI00396A7778
MGLCKCPKRKVTNLFCFEHRVNVCEHCLVANHPKCIVQSYLHWLQDSDYDASCTLCKVSLSEGEVVRLICYDIFHWECLDQYAKEFPANTAPAGYTCPTCKNGIFPPNNLVSPVADALKQQLSRVNWARAGLGLPLIDEPTEQDLDARSSEALVSGDETRTMTSNQTRLDNRASAVSTPQKTTPKYSSTAAVDITETVPHARLDKKSSTNTSMLDSSMMTPSVSSPRKLYDATKEDKVLDMSHDHDADKYKRRSALDWLSRWFKSRAKRQKKDPNASFKKFAVILVFGLIGFFTLVIIMTRVGRSAANDDPFLDPMANPNIRVARGLPDDS